MRKDDRPKTYQRPAEPKRITRDQMQRDAISNKSSQAQDAEQAPRPRTQPAVRPYGKPGADGQVASGSAAKPSPWGAIKTATKPEYARKFRSEGDDTAADRPKRERAPYVGRNDSFANKPKLAPILRPPAVASVEEFEEDSDHDLDATQPERGVPDKAQRERELRIYGKHAVLAVVRDRIDAVRKVYYHRSAQNALGDLLRWCAANRIGYREVELDDLSRLSGSEHHEGMVVEILKPERPTLADFLPSLIAKPYSTLMLLDGVANPHNIGAILRLAAHFGVDAVLLNPGNATALNGASYRVAEGGAEAQPFFALQNDDDVQALKAAGFSFVASQMRQAKPLWGNKFAKKVVLIFGAEGSGVSDYMHRNADLRLQIPGSGKVESLNVAQSAAIVLAELQRQRG